MSLSSVISRFEAVLATVDTQAPAVYSKIHKDETSFHMMEGVGVAAGDA